LSHSTSYAPSGPVEYWLAGNDAVVSRNAVATRLVALGVDDAHRPVAVVEREHRGARFAAPLAGSAAPAARTAGEHRSGADPARGAEQLAPVDAVGERILPVVVGERGPLRRSRLACGGPGVVSLRVRGRPSSASPRASSATALVGHATDLGLAG
jgi:hypothetical protein